MSLLFDNSNDYAIATGTPPVTAIPLTIAMWHKASATGAADCLIHLGVGGGSNANSVVIQRTTGNTAQIRTYDATLNNNNATTATFADTNWHHYCGAWSSATARYVYLDGTTGSGGSASETSRAPAAAFTNYKLGEMFDGTLDLGGNLGYIAIWNVALNTTEVAALAAGAHPKSIRLANLKWYVEATNSGAPFVDEIAGFNLTASGSTAYNAAEPTVDAAPIVADLAVTEGVDVAALTGTVRVTATLAVTEGSDVAALTATVSWPVANADLAATEGPDVALFGATISWEAVVADLAVTESADIADLAATISWTTVAADLAATEASDVAAFVTVVVVAASFGVDEAADVALFGATIAWAVVNTTLAATEISDVAAFAATVVIASALSVVEDADVAALGATVAWAVLNTTLAATEASDVGLFAVTSRISVVIAAIETGDAANFAVITSGIHSFTVYVWERTA